MTGDGPFELILRLANLFEATGVAYAVGGSMASSLIGEPRVSMDVDLAIRLVESTSETLLQRLLAEFYVPEDSAREALARHSSFNVLDGPLKADLFVLGDGPLDRSQIERRVRMWFPDGRGPVWVTAPEDQVLRKLDWYRAGGRASDNQWRDVVGILRIVGPTLDREHLRSMAELLGLSDDLASAFDAAD